MLDERLSGVRVRRDGADLDVGMSGEEAEDLAARIAGCAGDGDGVRHASTLTVGAVGDRGGDTGARPSSAGIGRQERGVA